jgi:hypothetical protein
MSSVSLRSKILKLVFLILLVAPLSLIVATPSQAAPTASAHPRCGNCTYVDTYVPGSASPIPYPCQPEGYNWNYPSVPIYWVTSHCRTRVWLHEDPWNGKNWGSGWTLCVSPLGSRSIPSQNEYPHNIYISENTSAC